MTPTPTNEERATALGKLLAKNAAQCKHANIVVRVDRINADQSVAFCSVEQLHRGLFRRDRSTDHLVWQAERALAPLRGHGLTPLINVQHRSLRNASTPATPTASPSLMDWIRDLWGKLGRPMSREGFSPAPVAQDPFGWRRAMIASGGGT
ncbi:MAG: hypothetical protein K8H89_09905 [Flavobacteriales bacterium]|jgi:hypothetical protein|nr:hypothetical protein [Flavobacteriales bacterium]